MSTAAELETLTKKICSLDTDKNTAELQKILQTTDQNLIIELTESIIKILNDEKSSNESKLGCLRGAKLILISSNKSIKKNDFSDKLLLKLKNIIIHENKDCCLIEAAGDILCVLCGKSGSKSYEKIREFLYEAIKSPLISIGSDDNDLYISRTEICIKILQRIIDILGVKFVPFVNEKLTVKLKEILNTNITEIQEAGFYLVASIAACFKEHDGNNKEIFKLAKHLEDYIIRGLSTDINAVRLAACVASRRFLQILQNDVPQKELFYPKLLPRLCLNRYYGVDNIRIYSQETWRETVGCDGQEIVEKHLPIILDYYTECLKSSNIYGREAACSCLIEVVTKLKPIYVKPHIDSLLKLLLLCFSDESWSVRDGACLACGNIVINFPSESEIYTDKIFVCLFNNLGDSVPSLRYNAAVSLVNIVKVHPDKMLPKIISNITEGFDGVSKQPVDTTTAPMSTNIILSRKMSLCGNTTKLSRVNSTDHRLLSQQTNQATQPWEFADGCLILLSELFMVSNITTSLTPLMPLLAKACKKRHYQSHLILLETMCKNLPLIAKSLGKKNFKLYIDDFLEPIFYSLESENSLTSSAASQCLNQLSTFLGPTVLRARVEICSPSHLRHLDANLYIAPF